VVSKLLHVAWDKEGSPVTNPDLIVIPPRVGFPVYVTKSMPIIRISVWAAVPESKGKSMKIRLFPRLAYRLLPVVAMLPWVAQESVALRVNSQLYVREVAAVVYVWEYGP
jgi:hypothetical protein